MMARKLLLGILMLFLSQDLFAEDVIRYNKRINTGFDAQAYEKSSYQLGLLKLALEHSVKEFGPYRLVPSTLGYARNRAKSNLGKNKHIDIMWGRQSDFESLPLTAIHISLKGELPSYRALIIRKDSNKKFAGITSSTTLKSLRLGVVRNSYFYPFLKRDGYKVSQFANSHNKLFEMLMHKRFDYMSMPIYNAERKVKKYPQLMIVPHFMWRYYPKFYFHVHQNNEQLAKRIKLGLEEARRSGAFDRYLKSHPRSRFYFDFEQQQSMTILDMPLP